MSFLLKIIAWLPFWVLYGISTCLIYPILILSGYRRKVVRLNIARSFPEKSRKERRRIERRFYRNFADSIVETVKLLHVSDKQMERRVVWEGLDLIQNCIDAGQSVAIYFSHCFNWEWAPSVTLHLRTDRPVEFCQIYRPLRSAKFDALMLKLRSRFGSVSLPKATALRSLIKMRNEGVVSVTGFMSDQHPSQGDPGHRTSLLDHPTLMITGTETLAHKLDMAVMYWDIERTGRGHYKITTRLIADKPNEVPVGEITERYTRMLELTIRRDPSNWLWSHNRWKNPVD